MTDGRWTGIVFVLIIVVFANPLSAQSLFEEGLAGETGDAGGEQDSKASELSLEINGYLRGDIFLGKYTGKFATEVKSGYGEACLELKATKRDLGTAYGEIRFSSGYQDGSVGADFAVREAYVETYLGPLDIRLGHQIIMWGRADGTNPTNNLTPRDMGVFSPVEDDKRLANLALRTHLNFEPFRLEAVWVPFYAPSYFPSLNLPDNITMSEQPKYPDTNIKHSTGAARAHLLLPSFEMSLSYVYGQAILPGIALKDVVIEPGAPPDTTLAFASYPHHVVGADFSTTAGPVGIRGEVAFKYPVDYEESVHTPMPEIQYVLGLDHEFLGVFNVILQYVGKYVFDWEELSSITGPPSREAVLQQIVYKNRIVSGQIEALQHSATLRIEWKMLRETLNLSLLSMYNVTTGELFLLPKVSYDIIDELEVIFGGQIFLGPDDTLFGTIEESQSAGYVELRTSF